MSMDPMVDVDILLNKFQGDPVPSWRHEILETAVRYTKVASMCDTYGESI